MPAINESIAIRRPLETVFGFAGDYANDAQWRAGIVSLELDKSKTMTRGMRAKEILRFLGQEYVTSSEVTEYELNNVVSFKAVSGPFLVRGSRLVEPEGNTTKFIFRLDYELNGLLKLLSPLVERRFKQQVKGDLMRLKHLLETVA